MKRTTSIRFNEVALLGVTIGALVGCVGDQDAVETQTSGVRVIHASFDDQPVEVSVDGQEAISELAFGQSSGYVEMEMGTRLLRVKPMTLEPFELGDIAGHFVPLRSSNSFFIDVQLDVDPSEDYTIIALRSPQRVEAIVARDVRTFTSGKARVRFIHASPQAPDVDVRLDRQRVASGSRFMSVGDYVDLDAGTYELNISPAGTDEVFEPKPVKLENDKVYTLIAMPAAKRPYRAQLFIDSYHSNDEVLIGDL